MKIHTFYVAVRAGVGWAMSVFASESADALPADTRIYCIVLEGSERREIMEAEFEAHGLLSCVEWIVRERDVENESRGRFQSHQAACARAAGAVGLKAAVIVEDDCRFIANRQCGVVDGIRDAIDAIRGGCMICGIGGVAVGRYGSTVHSSLWCRDCVWRWTHCYVISMTGCIWMKSRKFRGLPYDVELAKIPGRSALLVHSVAFRRGGWLRDLVSSRACQVFMHRLMMFLGRLTCQ